MTTLICSILVCSVLLCSILFRAIVPCPFLLKFALLNLALLAFALLNCAGSTLLNSVLLNGSTLFYSTLLYSTSLCAPFFVLFFVCWLNRYKRATQQISSNGPPATNQFKWQKPVVLGPTPSWKPAQHQLRGTEKSWR